MFNILFINWNEIGDSIIQATRTFFGVISGYIYDFIKILYNLFELIAMAEFLDNGFIKAIYRKIGLILGIFMVFKLSFSLIQSLVDPDKFNEKKSGFVSIVVRCVIAIVLLGVTPAIFKESFVLQKLLIGADDNSNNIIYKLIIGKNVNSSDDFGIELASELFFSFYTDDASPKYTGGSVLYPDQKTFYADTSYELIRKKIEGTADSSGNRESFIFAAQYLAAVDGEGDYLIEFDMIFCIIVGCVVAWILIMYCIQTAVRVIQLAYLQLIAPIPIFSYISDPEGAFKKWIKQCTTTYLDLFIRLAIIYFVVYLVTFLLEQFGDSSSNLLTSTGLSQKDPEFIWVKIFLVIGLLLFAKKVPDLLKDLFPNMGGGAGKFDFGLKAPKEVSSFVKGTATLGAGVAIGGVAGMASGIRHGEGWRKLMAAPGGFIRGVASARTKGNIFDNAKKGMANVRNVNAKAYERHHDGSTFFGRMTPILAERNLASFEKELQSYNDYDSVVSFIDKELEKNAIVQSAMDEMQRMRDSGLITTTLPVMVGGSPVINKKTGRPAMKTVTRAATEADYEAAQKKIKDAKENALRIEIDKGDDVGLMSALANAEAIRNKGVQNGYVGYKGSESITDSSRSSSDRAKTFFSVKKETKGQTQEIQGAGGSRNKEYKRAKANSKYKPGGK